MFRSLRLRMALSHGAVLALIVVVLGATGYLLLSSRLEREARASVVAGAHEAAERVNGTVGRPRADTDAPSASAVREALFFPGGRVLGEQGETPSWLRPQPVPVATISARGEHVMIATLPVRSSGGLVATAVAAQSLRPQEQLLGAVRLLLLVGGLLAVAVSMAAGWALAGRAARPIRRAYAAQSNFAADASHELRTPLAFVRSGVEVLAGHDQQLGEEVLHEVDYLAGLTDRLLSLARADSGGLALVARPVDVAELCRRSAARNRRVLGLRVETPSLREGSPDAGVFAQADPVALEAALDAVLENVARHGGGYGELAWSRSGPRVAVRVIDHGPGMSAEQRARAFERFYRADPARRHEEGGTGLGLSLARTLVEAQHGRLRLEDTAGGGLTAVIEVPALDVGSLEGALSGGEPGPIGRGKGGAV